MRDLQPSRLQFGGANWTQGVQRTTTEQPSFWRRTVMHWDGLGQRFSGRFVDGMDERMVALVLAQGAHHQQHEEFGAEMLRMAATSRTGGIPRQPRATMVYPVQRFDGLKAAQARGDRLM